MSKKIDTVCRNTYVMKQTLQNAFDYINQRYVFNKENYSVIAKLTEQEKTYFALKHILLHMQKNILKIIHYEKMQSDASVNKDYREALLKMLVNIITLSHQVELPANEVSQLENSVMQNTTFSGSCLVLMMEVATQCEAFDHKHNPQDLTEGVLGALRIERATKELWSEVFCNFSDKASQRLSLKSALSEVGSVMKSS